VPAAAPPPASLRADAAAVVALLLLHLAFWWRAATLRGFLLISDILYFFEPAKSYLHESLSAGRLALWTPYLFCGYPLGAEGQVATFYPPSLLLSWLLEGGGAVNWLVISHLMLAAVSMYLLARLLDSSPFAAWLSGVVFSFSGYLFAHLHHLSLLCAAAWLPLVILFVERAWRRPVASNAALAALCWAAAALAGHPQTLFYTSLTVLFWVCWRTVQAGRSRQGWPVGRAVATLAITFLLGLGVAAVQLLLTRDLSATAPHGERGSLAYVTSFSLLGEHLFGLVSPNFHGSPAFQNYQGERYYWEYVLYLGLLPLLLALVGVATRRGVVLAGLAAGALLLALAESNPLYHLLRHLPGFADFRAPARWVFVFTFAAALLAGMGWDAVVGRRWLSMGRRGWLVGAVGAVLVLGDLWHFDRTLATLTSPQAYTLTNPVAETLQRDRGWWRVLIASPKAADAEWVPPGGWARNPDGWVEMRLNLGASVAQSYRLRSLYGYAGFMDSDHTELLTTAYNRMMTQQDARLLSLVGTRYLAVPAETVLPGFDRTTIGPFALYRNPGAFPRAFVVGEALPAASRDQALRRTLELAEANRLRQTAVVTGDLRAFRPAGTGRAEITQIHELRPEHVVIEATSERDALLVLNERWDPGWQAICDGRPAPLVEVDTVLMGVPLPQGRHTIEFVYRPRGLTFGLPISLASLAVCLGLIVATAVMARRRPTG